MSACKLCKQDRTLRRSHIVPEFLYKDLYNEIHQMMGINGSGKLGWRPLQKGLREELFCDDCEKLFNDNYEKPFLEFWKNSNPIPAKLKPNQVFRLDVPSYEIFKLFHLSILFRASVSTLSTYREASISKKYEERLREMILNKDPGDPWEFLIFGYMLIHHETYLPMPIISQPFRCRLSGHRCIGMIYAGIEWRITIVSHRLKDIEKAALQPDKFMPVIAILWNEHEIIKAANRALN